MPLHLLGKKSWNVYNPANIARVRRDEAAAQAREEAEEQRMQEIDAARRLAILRGEIPPPLEESEHETLAETPTRDLGDRHGAGRKRKRHGEDDTDFEMRVARERASAGGRAARELAAKPATSLTSLVDSKGHITLFSEPEAARPHEQNEEAAQEAARKEREFKDQYQMRLVNAAGREGQGLTDGGPWYASADGEVSGAPVPSKNVWGREDPQRKVREAARLDASDPLAMMKRGAKIVRELDKDRKRETEERARELRMLEKEERREERRRERKRRKEEDDRGRNRDWKRERRRDSLDRDDRSSRREAPRSRHEDHRGEHQEQERHHRDRRDSRRDRSDRSRRNPEELRRNGGSEQDRGREDRQEDRHGESALQGQ